MKKALLSLLEPGRVCDVVPVGQEFPTTGDFYWVDCGDDVTTHHRYNEETKSFVEFNIINSPGFAEEGYKVARTIAYKSVGEQMDMMFKELATTGTISPDGPWATHIATVKAEIPKDDPRAVYEYVLIHFHQVTFDQAMLMAIATSLASIIFNELVS